MTSTKFHEWLKRVSNQSKEIRELREGNVRLEERVKLLKEWFEKESKDLENGEFMSDKVKHCMAFCYWACCCFRDLEILPKKGDDSFIKSTDIYTGKQKKIYDKYSIKGGDNPRFILTKDTFSILKHEEEEILDNCCTHSKHIPCTFSNHFLFK
jgi:hypothetical protein